MKRREVIKGIGIAGMLSGVSLPLVSVAGKKKDRAVMRIIHMSDAHVYEKEEANAEARLVKAFQHMKANFSDADFIINSGDVIMDALEKDEVQTQEQWDLWHRVVEQENTFEMYSCIGNHDIWGAGSVLDPRYGKKWAVEALKIPHRYYFKDIHNWRFVFLDSTHINNNGEWYTAKLDQEQFMWLADTLANTPQETKVIIVSHIPIISASSFFVGESDQDEAGYWKFPHSWMHGDARRIVELFEQYPQVKGALSGHMHMVDRIEFKKVSYLCNGAICGRWWAGANYGFEAGYAVIDLHDDGTIESKYVTY